MDRKRMTLKRIAFLTVPPLHALLYGNMKFEGVDSITPPLGLLQLAAYVRQFGYSPHIIDGYAHRYTVKETLARIQETEPDVLGLTFTTPLFTGALTISHQVKKMWPKLKIVVGGPHVTALPEDTLGHECFNVGVVGEGEATLVNLLEAWNAGRSLATVAGIVYRDGDELVRTQPREMIEDLDSLPLPAWDLLPSLGPPYRATIVGTTTALSTPIITSRGCSGRCTFCDTSVFGKKPRLQSAAYVLGMIEHLLREYGMGDFLVYDDTFCANRQRVTEICEGILTKGWDVTWSCCARIDQVNHDMLTLMRKAGCWQIEYGIESADPTVLKLMKKGLVPEKARKVIKMTHDAGIQARGNFIFGNIGESRESIERTIRFILSTDLDYVQQSFLTPYPGSEVYRIASSHGTFDPDYNKMSNFTMNFVPNGLTREDLQRYSRYLFLRFYLRPRIMLRLLKSIHSWEALRRLCKSAAVWTRYVVHRTGPSNKHKSEPAGQTAGGEREIVHG
ncbi:MAG: B12-binding domain-containing radical SAM protein [Desulfobaccales bacterium]